MQDNLLWQYSLAVYRCEGVETLLLRLQDEFAADINLLLCCCWLGQTKRQLSEQQVVELDAAVANWRQQCMLPLRSIRRYVKAERGSNDLYQQFKNLELVAERRQQDLLVEKLDGMGRTILQVDVKQCIDENLRIYSSLLPDGQSQQLLGSIMQLSELVSANESLRLNLK